jgi:uncharacterized membrane protein YoaK (UPF0700 family)
MSKHPEEKMKIKHHLHLPKFDTFWIPVLFFACGVVVYALRFFENIVEENVPHLSAIAFLLVAIAFIMVWLGL